MKNNLKSIQFIWSYISHYWKSLIIVAFFIFASTYFQILGPRLLGQSIDDMSKYVVSQVGKNAIDDINDKILNEKELTKNEKEELRKITDGKDLSSKELKTFWETQLFLKDIIAIDKTRILEGKGFSQKQLDEINNSSQPIQTKFYLSSISKKDLKKIANDLSKVEITQKDIDNKYSLFIKSVTNFVLAIIFSIIGMFIFNILMVMVAGKY